MRGRKDKRDEELSQYSD